MRISIPNKKYAVAQQIEYRGRPFIVEGICGETAHLNSGYYAEDGLIADDACAYGEHNWQFANSPTQPNFLHQDTYICSRCYKQKKVAVNCKP